MIENLLIGGSVEGFVHLNAVGRQTLVARSPDGGIEDHIHLLVATGVFRRQGVGIHEEDDSNLTGVGGLRLRLERDLGGGSIDRESGGHVLLVVVVLHGTGLNRKVPLAVTELSVALGHLHLEVAQLSIPLLVLGIVTEGVGGFFVGRRESNAVLDFVLIEVGFAASLCSYFFHRAVSGQLAGNPSRGSVGDCGVAEPGALTARRTLHPTDQTAEIHRVDRYAGAC